MTNQNFHMVGEEVIGLIDNLVVDDDGLLGRKLLRQLVDRFDRHDLVRIAVDDQAGRRTGGQEGEVVHARRRGDWLF